MSEITHEELFTFLIGKTIKGAGVDDGEFFLVLNDNSNLWLWSEEDLSVTLDRSRQTS